MYMRPTSLWARFPPIAVAALILFWIWFFWAMQRMEVVDFGRTVTAAKGIIKNTSQPPAVTKAEFPKKHWQTSKVGITAIDKQSISEAIQSWRRMSPEYRYETLTGASSDTYVREAFSSRPNIVETFLAVKDDIVRADFVRYLLLVADGGVYSDIDTQALKPIAAWIPDEQKEHVRLVIGIEIDEPEIMWGDWVDNFVFCQSTMMAKPGHPIMEAMVENMIQQLNAKAAEQYTDISGISFSFQDVLRISGPKAFSDAVFAYLSSTTGSEITRGNFTRLKQPKRVGDVLVMPVNGFVPGQKHSNAGSIDDPTALVQHLGLGSWRKEHVFDKEIDAKKKADEDKKKDDEKKKQEEERKKQEVEKKKQEEGRKKEDERKEAEKGPKKKRNGQEQVKLEKNIQSKAKEWTTS